MTDPHAQPGAARHHRALRAILAGTLVAAFLLPLAVWALGGQPILAGATALAFAGLAGIGSRRGGPGAAIAVAVGLVGQCIAFTAGLTGHPWQIDAHMTFFAALAIIVTMTDLRALLAAAGLIAVHHLSLTIALPALVYPTEGLWPDLGRTVLHAAIVVIETAALAGMIRALASHERAGVAREEELRRRSEEVKAALAQSEAALASAEAAQTEAETATLRAERAQAEALAEAARKREADAAASLAAERMAQAEAEQAARLRALFDRLGRAFAGLRAGNLATRLDGPSEADHRALQEDFNAAMVELERLLRDIAGLTADVAGNSGSISQTVADLARRSERQAASVEQSAAAMTEIAEAVESAAARAAETQRKAAQTESGAEAGLRTVADAIDAMQRIEASAEEISKITSLIDDIAFQTNLLALNAGVEAARAGETGRGFAVVASEVRMLAQRSAEAAREINGLIDNSSVEVRNGARLVSATGDALSTIVTGIRDISGRVAEIATTSEEQNRTLTELNGAIVEIDRTSQDSATRFEETAAACADLSSQADALATAIGRFTVSPAQATPPVGLAAAG